MRLRRILTDTSVRSPASWEVRHRHAGWGPGAGRLGDTAGTERGAATAAYGGPFCQTSESSDAPRPQCRDARGVRERLRRLPELLLLRRVEAAVAVREGREAVRRPEHEVVVADLVRRQEHDRRRQAADPDRRRRDRPMPRTAP